MSWIDRLRTAGSRFTNWLGSPWGCWSAFLILIPLVALWYGWHNLGLDQIRESWQRSTSTDQQKETATLSLMIVSVIALLIGIFFAVAGAVVMLPLKTGAGSRLIQLRTLRVLIAAHAVITFSLMTFLAAIVTNVTTLGTVMGMLALWLLPALLWTAATARINHLEMARHQKHTAPWAD